MFSTVGDILSTIGVFSTIEGYHEYRGDVQCHGGYHDTFGGYHEYCGACSVPWGTQITKDFSPHGTEHPPWYS